MIRVNLMKFNVFWHWNIVFQRFFYLRKSNWFPSLHVRGRKFIGDKIFIVNLKKKSVGKISAFSCCSVLLKMTLYFGAKHMWSMYMQSKKKTWPKFYWHNMVSNEKQTLIHLKSFRWNNANGLRKRKKMSPNSVLDKCTV